MSVGFGSHDASGTFALDTGAAISFISTKIAGQLGLDSNGDGEFGAGDEQNEGTLPIGGIGGTIQAPVFLIDRFSLATDQGVDLVWHLDSLLSVLVVDLHPDLDGVLGADLLTSGWIDLDAILGGGDVDPNPGPIEKAHFDFRQFFNEGDTGKVYFDLSPSFDVIQPEQLAGDFNGDGTVDAADYTLWRDHLGTSFDLGGNGDETGASAGLVDLTDYDLWKSHFGDSSGLGATAESFGVPEPGGLLLVLLGTIAAVLARFRGRSSAEITSPVRCGASPCS